MDRLVVSGPLPPSTNNLYYTGKDGRRHLSKKAKDYKTRLQTTMGASGAKKLCPEPPFALHLHLRYRDRRKRDASNAVKLIEDSIFQYLGYDDSLVHDLHVWKYIDRENPGVTVELRHCSRELEAS